jgi:uncharacterized protein (TIGR03067 family)
MKFALRSLSLAIATIALVSATVALADEAADKPALEKDRKQIEGTWQIVSLVVNGTPAKPEDAAKLSVVNGDDGTWKLFAEGKQVSAGTSTFRPEDQPKTIDFTTTEGSGSGNLHLGIYELGEKTRKLCFAVPGKQRPIEFGSTPDSGHILVAFERK